MTTWVLLRGLAREARHWHEFPAALARALPVYDRVVALDLPGNGARCQEASAWSVGGLAAAVRADLERRRLAAPCVLVGLSLGGMVALQWSLHDPGVAGCVAINTSLGRLSPPWRRFHPAAARPLASVLPPWTPAAAREQAILHLTSHRPFAPRLVQRWAGYALEAPTSGCNALRQLVAAARWRGPPGAPAVPVLLLASTGDRLASVRCSRAIAQAWRVPLREHPWAGHDLTLDDPRWAAAQVARWWQEARR